MVGWLVGWMDGRAQLKRIMLVVVPGTNALGNQKKLSPPIPIKFNPLMMVRTEKERDRERETKSQGQVEDDGEVLLAPAACAPAAVVVVVNEEATSQPSSTSGRMYSDDGSKLVSLMVERTVHNSRN